MRVLIVDDLLENRKLLRDILRKFAECEVASSGEEALELFSMELEDGDPFDLVLLDIMMPGMDGQETLKQMRAVEEGLQIRGTEEAVIIMVTAMDSPQAVTAAFFQGKCTDYIAKPINREKLMDKLGEYFTL